MPIKFKCGCGHVLTVPDAFAGKNGKCPKCQKSVKVPMPKASAPKPVAAQVGVMDALLDDAGLKKRTGPMCPKCSADIRPGAVVCTNCGLNFELGEQMVGFDAKSQRPEFDNPFLQEASDNMVRDLILDLRRDRAAMPWWVIMSFLIGTMTLCAAGVVLVAGKFEVPAPAETFMGGLQRLKVFTVLGMTATITGLAIVFFAHMSITFFGFTKSAAKGLGCLFLPLLFSFPYGIMNWTENKAPVKAIMTASFFIGFGVFLIVSGDGFAKLQALPSPF
ncbi:MAG: zinc ribbon domain-containing protein [Aureliella sp.]